MMMMQRTLLALTLALLFPVAVLAQGADPYPRPLTLSWTNASEYVDGSLIQTGDLTGVKLDCFRHTNLSVPIFTSITPAVGEGLAQSETFDGAIPQPGTYICYGYSIVIGDIYSDASDPTTKKFVGKPRSITEFTYLP